MLDNYNDLIIDKWEVGEPEDNKECARINADLGWKEKSGCSESHFHYVCRKSKPILSNLCIFPSIYVYVLSVGMSVLSAGMSVLPVGMPVPPVLPV